MAEEIFDSRGALQEVRDNLKSLWKVLDHNFAKLLAVDPREIDRELETSANEAINIAYIQMQSIHRAWWERRIYNMIVIWLQEADDDDITRKRYLVMQLNLEARIKGFAFLGEDLREKILVVLTSGDGKGRYYYEDRETKKRKGAFKSLRDMMPLQLTADRPRDVFKEMEEFFEQDREIEARKQKDQEP